MSVKQFFAAALLIPTLGFSVAPALAFEGEGERPEFDGEGRRHHVPLAGELVSYDENTLTVVLIDGVPRVDLVLENLELEVGDELTYDLSDETKYLVFDGAVVEGEEPQEGSLEDFEIGEILFIASEFDDDGNPNAMVVANHAPKFNHAKPLGEVSSVDTDANVIVVEKHQEGNDWMTVTITITYDDDVPFLEGGEEITEDDLEAGDMIGARLAPKDGDDVGELESIIVHTLPAEVVE